MSFMTLPIVCLFAVCVNIWAFCYGRFFFLGNIELLCCCCYKGFKKLPIIDF